MSKKTKKISELLNKQLATVKNKLSKKVENKLTDEQIASLTELETNLQNAVSEMEALETETSNAELLEAINGVLSIFANSLETLQTETFENLAKLQKQILNKAERQNKVVNFRFQKSNAKKSEFVNYTNLEA